MTALELAEMFVEMARRETMRVSYKGGVQMGGGVIPHDTGATQETIHVSGRGKEQATVRIGNESVVYPVFLEFMENLRNGKPNMHKGFIEKFCTQYFAPAIVAKYGCDVKVEITGG